MPRNKNKLRVSPKWRNYTCYGKLIKNTRLICSKSPISMYGYTPESLVQSINNQYRKQKVGLVIDLTDTCKYYNPHEFIALNVLHHKIKCCGMAIPSEEIVEHFKTVITRYLKEHARNNKIICIHCFNGVNRSGYLLCRYLIDVLKYDAVGAINLFQDTRGHVLEHDYLREDLLQRKPLLDKDGDNSKCFVM